MSCSSPTRIPMVFYPHILCAFSGPLHEDGWGMGVPKGVTMGGDQRIPPLWGKLCMPLSLFTFLNEGLTLLSVSSLDRSQYRPRSCPMPWRVASTYNPAKRLDAFSNECSKVPVNLNPPSTLPPFRRPTVTVSTPPCTSWLTCLFCFRVLWRMQKAVSYGYISAVPWAEPAMGWVKARIHIWVRSWA